MVSYADFIHIFLTTLALVVLVSAGFQALLLASQEWVLKHKQAIGFIQYFPPLEVMETYLFYSNCYCYCYTDISVSK